MFTRISALLAVAIAVAASARMERHAHIRRGADQCNTGTIKCCQQVANASDLATALDKLSYSYNLADSVGLDCSPVNIDGAGQGATCQQQPVCCSNNTYSGTLSFNVGCSPMNFN